MKHQHTKEEVIYLFFTLSVSLLLLVKKEIELKSNQQYGKQER
jgi:hypothetical protein